ncbi:MAG: fimbrillin family protein, partial [Muribaculaceae bacterium]|nr:fimbrillin family protein [Muribaculaceae bacterium]
DPNIIGPKIYPDFFATIEGNETRAFDHTWEAGDLIGINGAGRRNVSYITKDNTGSFSVEKNGEQIYFQDDQDVTFTAYYPWSRGEGESTSISVDTRTQRDQKKFDFLRAQAKGSMKSPIVAFNFTHIMTKVVLIVKPGNTLGFEDIRTGRFSLSGLKHNGTFNTTDCSIMVSNNQSGEIWTFSQMTSPLVNETEKTLTYSLILFPQLLTEKLAFSADVSEYNLSADIDFTAANVEKDGSNAKNELVAGRQYVLRLTLNKSGCSLDNCAIKPWNNISGDEITVD